MVKPISLRPMPERSMAACTTGMRISTSLRVSSARTLADWAKETTATSRITRRPSHVLLVGVELGVGLAGGPEVQDALERGLAVGRVAPHGLDAHAHVHVGRDDLLDEVHQADVGPVEEDGGRYVRDLDLLSVEGDVHDAERRHRSFVGELAVLVGGDTARRARAARW